MQKSFDLGAILRPLGPCRHFVSRDFAATLEVDTAGALKDATSIPLKSATTVPLLKGQQIYFGSLTKVAVVAAATAAGVSTVTVEALAAALVAGDKAHPWFILGGTEGNFGIAGGWNPNALTAPEQTGDFWHRVVFVPGGRDASCNIIPSEWFFEIASPSGSEDGPPEDAVDPDTYALFVVPLGELGGAAGLSYEGTSWAPAAPKGSLFYPKCVIWHDDESRPFADGGKTLVTTHFRPLYYPTGPSGKRGWVRGDPAAKGYTTFRF